MEYKSCQTEIKELDENTGMVVFYAAVFGNEDLGGDILVKGATTKTIQENAKNIRHFKHHNSTLMPGVVKEISEDSYGVLVKSQLILSTQLGRETYEEYKAMASAQKSMDHSIGYKTIKFDEDRKDPLKWIRFLKEIKLFEVSSLTGFGMNPLARTVDVKTLEQLDFNILLTEQKYFDQLLKCRFTDAKLEHIEQVKKHIDDIVLSRKQSTQPQQIVLKGSDLINNLNFNLNR